jgi:hypothetical protein
MLLRSEIQIAKWREEEVVKSQRRRIQEIVPDWRPCVMTRCEVEKAVADRVLGPAMVLVAMRKEPY